MTADELVEAVARAMYEARRARVCPHAIEWAALDNDYRESFRDEARAAIRAVHEAMREPSEDMEAAGGKELRLFVAPHLHVDKAWRAMLAASPLSEAARDA